MPPLSENILTSSQGQGGDWGSLIVRTIGSLYPDHCVAVHVNMVVSGPPSWKSPLTLIRFIAWAIWQDKSKDGSLLGRMMWWQKDEQGMRSQFTPLFSSCFEEIEMSEA